MTVFTDSIEERTPGAGVTIDGLTVKDGDVPGFVTDAELTALTPADIGAEVAGAAATAVADHESAYDHANIPTADQSAALAAYEIALGLAEAGQVLTADGVGAAAFVGASPKRLVALVTQSGTNAPTLSILENGLGGAAIVASRSDTGTYSLSSTGAFSGSVFVLAAPSRVDKLSVVDAYKVSDDQLNIETYTVNYAGPELELADSLLYENQLLVWVY
ncbi:MAG: hypothetical protein KBE23_06460 [Chloroflexi bacterium]|nr:hypothetical protein [Chloroflexota bacterium]MBP7042367.1 hypothetical protein [Chloroflexota bacterium]